jgi:hypothetical protein
VHFDLKCDNLLCDLRDLNKPVVKVGHCVCRRWGGRVGGRDLRDLNKPAVRVGAGGWCAGAWGLCAGA